MAHVELVQVTKHYGLVTAVDGLSLEIAAGERLALLGPSGCGKTTTLNLVAGFLQPDDGVIRIDGRDVVGIPAHKRNTGMVFQNYALFPHLTVFDNVAFGLRIRKTEAREVTRRVEQALGLVRLEGLAGRFPRQLSGGQQQRVALARALVIEPAILLLDEPLSNLDAKLRQQMRMELLEILRAVGTTAIFVTHDQEEALGLAERVAIMNAGRVEQLGSPSELYENPATAFVAKFLGESNVLLGTVRGIEGTEMICEVSGGYRIRSCRHPQRPVAIGAPVEVIVRAERLHIARVALELPNCFTAELEHVLHLGMDLRYIMRVGEHRLVAVIKNRGDGDVPHSQTAVYVGWTARDALVLPLTGN
jgi:ABC-type Fe3+/spermidine/putrescine transport system ATPase subunit